jgi:putative ABC transport system ATP-binding protein
MALLSDLHQQGTTIILVTHDPRYADMAHRQINLLDGQVVNSTSNVKTLEQEA